MELKVYRYTSEFQERLLLHRIYLKKEDVSLEALLVLADIINRSLEEPGKKNRIPFGTLSFSVLLAKDGYFFDAYLNQAEVKRLFSDPFKKAVCVRMDKIEKEVPMDEKLLSLSKEGLLSYYRNEEKNPENLFSKMLSLPLSSPLPELGLRREVSLEMVKSAYSLISNSMTGVDFYLGTSVKKDPFYSLSKLSTVISEEGLSSFPEDKMVEEEGLPYDRLCFVYERPEIKTEKERKEREVFSLRVSSWYENLFKKELGSKVVVSRKMLTPKYSLLSCQCEAKKRNRFKDRIISLLQKEEQDIGSYFESSYNQIRTRQVLFNEEPSLLLKRISENACFSLSDGDEDYFSPLDRKKESIRQQQKDRKKIHQYIFLSKENA